MDASSDRIEALVEKPMDPPSDLGISDIYIIEDTIISPDVLDTLIDDVRGAIDEYQLTDGLQRMLDTGVKLGTFDLKNWYDCGRPETLLAVNRVLLEATERILPAPRLAFSCN